MKGNKNQKRIAKVTEIFKGIKDCGAFNYTTPPTLNIKWGRRKNITNASYGEYDYGTHDVEINILAFLKPNGQLNMSVLIHRLAYNLTLAHMRDVLGYEAFNTKMKYEMCLAGGDVEKTEMHMVASGMAADVYKNIRKMQIRTGITK